MLRLLDVVDSVDSDAGGEETVFCDAVDVDIDVDVDVGRDSDVESDERAVTSDMWKNSAYFIRVRNKYLFVWGKEARTAAGF